MMFVKVEFIVETDDYDPRVFQKEVETLTKDIDPESLVYNFRMFETRDPTLVA